MELEEMFSVLPAFRGVYQDINYDYPGILNQSIDKPYISELISPMSVEEIKGYLTEHKILEKMKKGE